MDLELEQLAPYLPYGLECLGRSGNQYTVSHFTPKGQPEMVNVGDLLYSKSEHTPEQIFKPILRPLSDLAKDRFWDYIVNYATGDITDILPYSKVQELLKERYDVFGLIDAGLAVDINTLD